MYLTCTFLHVVVNFRIILPEIVSESIGSIYVCIEQMNGQLNDDIQVNIQTSQIGTSATGILWIIILQSFKDSFLKP